MTFLEMLPIALAICLWHKEFHKKKILFHIDNLAVVSILTSKISKTRMEPSSVKNPHEEIVF
jgi:hypothetical protein